MANLCQTPPLSSLKNIQTIFKISKQKLVLFFQFSKLLGAVDVNCIVSPGGVAAQAGAIRYATSLCLRSFVDPQTLVTRANVV